METSSLSEGRNSYFIEVLCQLQAQQKRN